MTPPTPVFAPPNGSTAEGWLCVSALTASVVPAVNSTTPALPTNADLTNGCVERLGAGAELAHQRLDRGHRRRRRAGRSPPGTSCVRSARSTSGRASRARHRSDRGRVPRSAPGWRAVPRGRATTIENDRRRAGRRRRASESGSTSEVPTATSVFVGFISTVPCAHRSTIGLATSRETRSSITASLMFSSNSNRWLCRHSGWERRRRRQRAARRRRRCW